MKDQEIFDGFTLGIVKRAKEGESYFIAEALVLASVKNVNDGTKEQSYYDNLIKKAHAIFKEVVDCIESGNDPTSEKVQRIIKKHHAFTEEHHSATKEVYKALAQLYREHPAYRKQLDPFHPELAEFLAQGMEIFAKKKL